ncbi:hypothetical protein V2A60_007299 [Cordyceps javanica]|uniref:Metallopeptidase MepB n=1 Tax=Cordyceps javanica TaxID=43265 RepID=A0A545VBC5_9HYPO|nr:metallopeptidase MepB [Cordyceps javanica]TQW10222.1 metallopeptidase MepB [Cordyceps javanica]
MTSNTRKTPPQLLQLFNRTPESIASSDVQMQAEHKALLDRIADEVTPETATFASVLRPVLLHEDVSDQGKWGNFMYSRVSADKPTRDASRQSIREWEEYEIECGAREDVSRLIDAAYATRGAQNLDRESIRLLERERLKYQQKGMLIEDDKERQRFKDIQKRISQLCSEAIERLDESTAGIWFTPEQLVGVDGNGITIAGLEKGTGENEGKFKVSFISDHSIAVMRYAERESTRREYFIAEQNMANENASLFKEVIQLRDEAARMIGFPNHASLRIANKMAKTPETVNAFLNDLEEQRGIEFDKSIYLWDRLFYSRMRKNVEFGIEDTEISKYFPVKPTIQGLLGIFSQILGVEYAALSRDDCARLSPTGVAEDVLWHEEVEIYEVWDDEANGGQFCGYLYLDLFPREGKYKQDMTLPIGPGCTKADGTRHYASTALVCNLSRPSPNQTALLQHHDLITVFHELGHGMDTLCCRTQYERSADLEQDCIEIPSSMLEYWCWEPAILKSLSSHCETGEKIPAELVANLCRLKNVHANIGNRLGLVRDMFDYKVHTFATHDDAKAADCTLICNQLIHDVSGMKGPEHLGMGMDWGCNYLTFDHVLSGYDAGMYAYRWSEVVSADMYYSQFKQDPLSREQGQRYRRMIMEHGGSRDFMESLTEFLGRAPNAEAYQREEIVSV